MAAEWAGIKTVAFCEREPFPQKVLKKHWPDIPIYDDVCTLTKERLEADGIDCSTIGVIFSGDPCQPYSGAGKRQGENDDRFLWPEVNRLMESIRPRWIVRENVAGNITLGLDGVLSDLEDLNYTARTFVIPACSVGASHKRERVFVVAHSNSELVERDSIKKIQGQQTLQSIPHTGSIEEWSRRSDTFEPKLLRSLNGISSGVARLKALGNAVVPQHIYPILAAIKQIDDMIRS